MPSFLPGSLEQALSPHTPVLEIIIRGSIMYLALFALLRAVPRRETGGAGVADLLVVVLLADAAQNAMAGSYTSVPDGLILVSTIVAWSWLLNWLGFHFRAVERLISPRAVLLVRHGQMLRRNMRRELVTEDELWAQLRLQGVSDLHSVREARMEADGRISVVTGDGNRSSGAREKQAS